ncbi:ATP-binding protein [Chitinibacteraceae bacterium HSL-7]
MISSSDHLLAQAAEDLLLAIRASDLMIVAANASCARALQRPLDAIIGHCISEFECALQDVFFWQDLERASVDDVFRSASSYVRADGSRFDADKTVRVARDDDGDRLYLVEVRDTQAERDLLEVLDQTTSLMQATLESIGDGILVCNASGGIRNYNRRFVEVWGLREPPSPDQPDPLAGLFARMKRPRVARKRLTQILEDHLPPTTDRIELVDGRTLSVRTYPQLLHGQVIGRVIVATDISSELATIAALEEARTEALAAARAKGQFLAQMSHELRTPLNVVLGYGQLMSESPDGETRQQASSILQAGNYLLDLITDILDMSAAEAGKLSVHCEPVNVLPLIHECLHLVETLAQRGGIRLVHPQTEGEVWAHADRIRLKQMLMNLLSNAIKYNRDQGVVELRVRQAEGQVQLVIEDTGLGISSADLGRLFKMFSRVGAHQRSITGTGIGLALTRELARLMHGDVVARSVLGQGSVFTITLQESAAPRKRTRSVIDTEHIAFAPGTRVLYVEDEPMSRVLLQRFTARWSNLTLNVAASGAAGVEAAAEHDFNLILSDMNLGDMDGFEFVRELRSFGVETPVWAISADHDKQSIQAALAFGFERYLTKPVNLPELAATLARALNRS